MPFQITRRLRILAIIGASLLLLYAALGFWLVPRLVRGEIEEFSAQHWKRKPAMGEITFNPFTLALELKAFDFRDSRGEALLARPGAAAAVGDAVGAGAVPRHADHQTAVVPEIGRPPLLRVRHHGG